MSLRKLSEETVKKNYERLGEDLSERDVTVEDIKEKVKRFEVEVPSWLFGEFGGGRFGDYMPPAPAPDSQAKIRDAAFVHELTGAAPRVAIHVGWDKPEDVPFGEIKPEHFVGLREYAREQGIDIGAVNPTLFLEGTHHGSLSSPLDDVRRLLIDHCHVSCEIADKYAQGLVTYWLPDGSQYPGQRDLWHQEDLVRAGLREVYDEAPDNVEHLIEYKLFEPGTYSTVVSDAGVAGDIAAWLGEKAGVLVDMGHHAWGVNVAQIVSRLLGMGVKAGFHFNSRYAADDDHAVEPNVKMYEIFCELAKADVVTNEDPDANWAYMVDQCSSLENRIRAVLHTIDSLQISYAKSLLLDPEELKSARMEQDIIGSNRVFLDAFLTDVRPIVRMGRMEKGLPLDPVVGYDTSGYQEKIEKERKA
ncbi:MAG: L-rhamnose isomerase [Planctomycetes bacterium]|nr:L-rhamnose isomerase [Planctomycetota bacterium]